MQKYDDKIHRANRNKYNEMFDPIARLKTTFNNDVYLNNDADFYRIISPDELIELCKTKVTGEYIDSNGHFTNGHYSCVTTNPNYNEQAFSANGLPIRLKFKTKDSEGLYNMDLLNRIGCLKPERSIYRVFGYNFYDIDWDNVCINNGLNWERLPKKEVDEIIEQVLSHFNK